MEKICCFFGHRDTVTEVHSELYAKVEKHITQYNVTTFYVGGYSGFDRMSAAVSGELKQKYPHIKIILVLAYLPTEKRAEYKTCLYGSTIYPEVLETVPQKFAIAHRNRWIVEQSDYLIAYARTSYGGAYEALQYAKRKGKQVINIYETLKISIFPYNRHTSNNYNK